MFRALTHFSHVCLVLWLALGLSAHIVLEHAHGECAWACGGPHEHVHSDASDAEQQWHSYERCCDSGMPGPEHSHEMSDHNTASQGRIKLTRDLDVLAVVEVSPEFLVVETSPAFRGDPLPHTPPVLRYAALRAPPVA